MRTAAATLIESTRIAIGLTRVTGSIQKVNRAYSEAFRELKDDIFFQTPWR